MAKRAGLAFVVVAMAASTGEVARAQEALVPVEPLNAPKTGSVPEIAELRTPPAPQARDSEGPRLRFDPPRLASTSDSPTHHSEPETAQLVIGILVGAVTAVVAAETYVGTNHNVWYTGAVVGGGALTTGAIVCALGQISPTRRGGCRGSLVGALVGVVGAVPGLLLLHMIVASPCSATGEARDGCLGGQAVLEFMAGSMAGVGYATGTAFGARQGWKLDATSRDPSPIPTATASLLSVQF